MATITIGEFAEMLSSLTDDVKQLDFPIDFKDASASDMDYINDYNKLLAAGDYNGALEYRTSHPELECFIWDANKMNILQTLVLTVHSALGTKYDNEGSKLDSDNVQEAIDELVETVNDCFQSVSDGKKLIASAITDKKNTTDADAAFETMAANIKKITTGSGNAYPENVLKGKTFTNDNGTYEGTMTSYSKSTVKSTSYNLDNTNKNVLLNIPSDGFYNTSSKVFIPFNNLAKLIGLTADKIIKGNSLLGISGTATPAPTIVKGTFYLGKIMCNTKISTTISFGTNFIKPPSVVTVSFETNHPNLTTIDNYEISNITQGGFHIEFTTAGYNSGTIPEFYLHWIATL